MLLVQLLKTILAVYDPTDTVAPTVLTLVRTRLASDEVTETLACEPVIAPGPDELMTPDDVLRIARVRGQAQILSIDRGRRTIGVGELRWFETTVDNPIAWPSRCG